jgi:tRNA isopentenyl-2-thiomethyl-A-37 hydroxylase MiaE
MYVVSYYRKAVCLNLFAALPNVFYQIHLTIVIKQCLCHFLLEMQHLRGKSIKLVVLKRYKITLESSTINHTEPTHIVSYYICTGF